MAPDITVEELKQRLEKKETIFIIDVREPIEFAEFSITEINIPLGMLSQKLWDFDERTEEEIVVCCRSGMRSASAKMILIQAGFRNVRNLAGGILDWQDKNPK